MSEITNNIFTINLVRATAPLRSRTLLTVVDRESVINRDWSANTSLVPVSTWGGHLFRLGSVIFSFLALLLSVACIPTPTHFSSALVRSLQRADLRFGGELRWKSVAHTLRAKTSWCASLLLGSLVCESIFFRFVRIFLCFPFEALVGWRSNGSLHLDPLVDSVNGRVGSTDVVESAFGWWW